MLESYTVMFGYSTQSLIREAENLKRFSAFLCVSLLARVFMLEKRFCYMKYNNITDYKKMKIKK